MSPGAQLRRVGRLLALGVAASTLSASAAEGAFELKAPRLSGFIQPNFTWGPGEEGRAGEFFLRRARLRADGELGTPVLGYSVSLELAKSQRPLRDGYVAVRGLGHELRLGQFKVPFGWEVPVSVTRLPTVLLSVVEPLATGRDMRDIGLGLCGRVELGGDWALEDGLAVVNGEGANARDTTPKKDVFGRVGLLRGKWLRLGVSAASVEFTRDDAVVERSTRAGVDVGVERGPVRLLAEYARGWYVKPGAGTAWALYGAAIVQVGPGVDVLARYEQREPAWAGEERPRHVTAGATYTHEKAGARFQLNYRHGLEAGGGDLLLLQGQYVF